MSTTTLIVIPLIGIAYIIYTLSTRKMNQDAAALFWATVNEPFILISENPFDDDLDDRAEEICALLKKHGNQFLDAQISTKPDEKGHVWVYTYRVQITGPESTYRVNNDFAHFHALARHKSLERQEQWRNQKLNAAPDSRHTFTSQKKTYSNEQYIRD